MGLDETVTDINGLIKPAQGLIWRIVETQEVAATREITRNADEQSRLEALLESAKPAVPKDCEGLSYLLFTPFRYPPLDYGSRFGSTLERGIYYGAKEIKTALAETAVYMWLFQSALKELGPLRTINDHRTAIAVNVLSDRAVDLTDKGFLQKHPDIVSADNWQHSQRLGAELRELRVDWFWFPSARLAGGTNAAVFNPLSFKNNEPVEQLHWQIRLSEQTCWFSHLRNSLEFEKEQFMVDGKIPHPMA